LKKSFKFVVWEIIIKIFLITLPILEILWLIILFFMEMEKDHIGGLQILIGILGVVVTIITFLFAKKQKTVCKIIIYFVIILILLLIDIGWSWGIARQGTEMINTFAVGKTENGENNSGGVKELEKNLKILVLQDDYFLKSLTEYTNEQGDDSVKITAIFESEIADWMKNWNIYTLGKFGSEYEKKRERIDEIYTICCLGEMKSEHIKDRAVDDFILCIEEIHSLHNDYINPELLKEEAGKYIELGDLCVDLGRQREAADFYRAAMRTAWEGVEESIKYGMLTNAKETLEIMSTAYKRVDTLPEEFDDWDCKRASIIGDVLQDLSDSFDTRFPHD